MLLARSKHPARTVLISLVLRCCGQCIEPGQPSLLCGLCSLLARFAQAGGDIGAPGDWFGVMSGSSQWSGCTMRARKLPGVLRARGQVSGKFSLCGQAPVWIWACPPSLVVTSAALHMPVLGLKHHPHAARDVVGVLRRVGLVVVSGIRRRCLRGSSLGGYQRHLAGALGETIGATDAMRFRCVVSAHKVD